MRHALLRQIILANSTLYLKRSPTNNVCISAKYSTFYETTLNKTLCLSSTSCLEKRNFSTSNSNKRENSISKWFRNAYENFEDAFERKAPSVKKYVDYLSDGMRSEWNNLKRYPGIKRKMKGTPYPNTTYKEEMIVYWVNRNMIKVIPLFTIMMLPMGFFMVCFPIIFFPRYVLPQTFWTARQRREILTSIHNNRLHYYSVVIHHINYHKHHSSDAKLRSILTQISDVIKQGQVPQNSLLLSLRPHCSQVDSPFNGEFMPHLLLRAFCSTIMVSQWQPPWLILHRLRTNANMVLNLDRKLNGEKLLKKLSPAEMTYACLMRGLDSAQLSREANTYWLQNWVELTKHCDANDSWFVLHAMVLLSYNYTDLKYKRKVFG